MVTDAAVAESGASVRKSVGESPGVAVSPFNLMPPPPRNPSPLTETVAPPRARVPLMSIARRPPVAPFHGVAVSVDVSVPVVYCGTRITWNVRWPCVVVAANVCDV